MVSTSHCAAEPHLIIQDLSALGSYPHVSCGFQPGPASRRMTRAVTRAPFILRSPLPQAVVLLAKLEDQGQVCASSECFAENLPSQMNTCISILVMEPTNACNLITLFAQSGCKACKLHPPGSFPLPAGELTTHVKLIT